MQFELPSALAAVIRKKYPFEVDVSDFPQVSLEKIWTYGFQQLLNDAAAPAKEGEDPRPFVQKRLDNLRAGILRASAIRTGNPVAVEARSIATKKVGAAWLKKHGAKPGKADKDQFTALVTKYAARPDVMAQAKANVAATDDLDVDIEI